MKRLFNLFLIFAFTGSLLMTYSCSEDFLTKEPPGSASSSYMETPLGVEALLISTYSAIHGRNGLIQNRAIFGGALATDWTYGGVDSDDCYKGSTAGDQSNTNEMERYEVLPNNLNILDRWEVCYDGVARANNVLVYLKKTQAGKNPLATTRATEIEAEAKFLRAWYHFKLNRVFKNIPYIKTPEELKTLLPEQVPNDSPGWDNLEADLQFAIDNLPATKPLGQIGRADKYAAMVVKAHAHMYQNELSLAKPLLDAIIASNKYSLVANYYNNYNMTTENNKESILEIQAATSATNHSSMLLTVATQPYAGAAALGGWGFYQPSKNLFNAFQVTADGLPVLDVAARDPLVTDMGVESKDTFVPTDHLLDPRVDWTISRRGIDHLGWGICTGKAWIREQSYGGPFMTKKYQQMKSEVSLNAFGPGIYNGKNYRAYRLANVLLWRAEIAVEDGELDAARLLVNQIRNRAKGSAMVMGRCTTYAFPGGVIPVVDYTQPAANYKVEPYPVGSPVFATKEEARKAVRLEIRLEFATEGHRFFDLRRWGIADEVLNAYIAQDLTFRNFLSGAHFDPGKDDYMPIPQSQLDIQPGVLKQDPAYK